MVATVGGVAFTTLTDTGSPHIAADDIQPRGGPVSQFAVLQSSHLTTAAAHDDGSISILDPATRRLNLPPVQAAAAFAFDRRGMLLVTDPPDEAGRVGHLRLLDPAVTGMPQRGVFLPNPQWPESRRGFTVQDIAVDDRFVVAAGRGVDGGILLVWDARTREPLARLQFGSEANARVDRIRLAAQSNLLVARNNQNQTAIWKTSGWTLKDRFPAVDNRNLDFALDGPLDVDQSGEIALLASTRTADATKGSRFTVVDLETNAHPPLDAVSTVTDLAFTSGNEFVTASTDNIVRVWSRYPFTERTDKKVDVGQAPTGLAGGGPDGLVAVTLADGQVVVIDPAAARSDAMRFIDRDGVPNVKPAWDPSGRLLAAASDRVAEKRPRPAQINLWLVQPDAWRDQLCTLAGRDVTVGEWSQWVGTLGSPTGVSAGSSEAECHPAPAEGGCTTCACPPASSARPTAASTPFSTAACANALRSNSSPGSKTSTAVLSSAMMIVRPDRSRLSRRVTTLPPRTSMMSRDRVCRLSQLSIAATIADPPSTPVTISVAVSRSNDRRSKVSTSDAPCSVIHAATCSASSGSSATCTWTCCSPSSNFGSLRRIPRTLHVSSRYVRTPSVSEQVQFRLFIGLAGMAIDIGDGLPRGRRAGPRA